ncbi:hypothetical protein HPP92_007114 [Vanilla planifolia]|uniref:Pentatricopeptide repeat-containing protein n=1 Tax=Vanilla planifolia TaxID=51239 RepID=A0A835V8D8_VANPL|nr:hypothetical protein HPP92_007114 [Vanilla planifolia]
MELVSISSMNQTVSVLPRFELAFSLLKSPRYPFHAKTPWEKDVPRFLLKSGNFGDAQGPCDQELKGKSNFSDVNGAGNKVNSSSSENNESEWSQDELETIAALFERRMPPKPGKRQTERPLPLPTPYRKSLPGIPTPKRHIRSSARETLFPRSSFSDQVSKNPEALIRIAQEIAALASESDVSEVLDEWFAFLRKGSLSITIRELGRMGLPKRALQTLCWAQKRHPALFPDDRTLSSAIEILARNGELKIESDLENFLNTASRSVVEAMARGLIGGGNLSLARQLLLLARNKKRTLDPSIHAKLILEAGRTPNGYKLALALLDELGERESLDLKPQDTTSIMKVCIRLGRFDAVESLFNWFKDSGRTASIVMYTTMIYSCYCCKKYKEGMALVWEMEKLNILLDLPAYRVVIRLCVALEDLERAGRYFSRLKEAGFAPTYDIYKDMIKAYTVSGRLAKCRKICKEVEMAGLKFDKETLLFFLKE